MISPTILTQTRNIFQQVKVIPFPEVFRAFHGEEIRKNKARCPFHQDNNPSLHLYQNGFFCFGCGERGDSIAFVSRLHNIRPLDAARLIAEKFGLPLDTRPISRKEKLRLAQEKALKLREKLLRQAFENWCKEAGTRARMLAEAIRSVLDEKGVEVDDELLPMIHLLPLFEYWAEVLNTGPVEEKVELYRNGELKRWLLCD